MVILFHHPFCPHSRFVRIVLGEYGAPARLVEERAWERREGFLALNPDGTTPVLVEDGHPAVPGAHIIAEYLDEVYGPMLAERRLLPVEPFARVEVRRLASWFNDRFFAEVSGRHSSTPTTVRNWALAVCGEVAKNRSEGTEEV